jgi:PBP1b-binding outer membrane lipoprotein LpoB
MKKWMLILLLAVILTGCCKSADETRNQQSVDQCIKAGGIPIFSTWDGRLKDCIFPPKK